jgi:pleiotropic regulator 1
MTVGKKEEEQQNKPAPHSQPSGVLVRHGMSSNVVRADKPRWHPPWELSAVISGHVGWVRSIAFDPSNEWFATGSADRTIKIWDLAKACTASEGSLKLTLTGHIDSVRALAVSDRHPYLFSAGDDKQVKCWDLETNKVVRHYHGHLSGVRILMYYCSSVLFLFVHDVSVSLSYSSIYCSLLAFSDTT